MDIMQNNEVESVERIVRLNAQPIVGITDRPFIIAPAGAQSSGLEMFQDQPYRIREDKTFREVDSFLEYVKKFRTIATMVFEGDTNITAMLDYHDADKPSWKNHTASLQYRYDDVFQAWLKRDGMWSPQTDFSEFLELNTLGIVNPSEAEIVQVAKTLEANSTVAFRSAIRTQNGDVQFCYYKSTEAKAGERGELSIPSVIELLIPVFQGALSTAITMKLFWKIGDNDKKLSFRVQMLNKNKVLEMAKKQMRSEIEEGLKIKILR